MLKVLNISMVPVRFKPFHHISQFFTEILYKGFRVTRFEFFIGEISLSMLYLTLFLLRFGTKPILQFLRSKQHIYEC